MKTISINFETAHQKSSVEDCYDDDHHHHLDNALETI